MTVDELALSWLHCNECHRSFEHHNRLANEGEGMRILQSDLVFSFTSCGHFFCDSCVRQHTIGGKLMCPQCQTEASPFRVDNQVPKSLEMYLCPPAALLEDALSVMTVKFLRAKVSQQKELLSKAKQELAGQKLLKEKLNELQEENERLRRRLDDVTRAAGGSATPKPTQSPTLSIHVPGRLSLRSPMRTFHPTRNTNGIAGATINDSAPIGDRRDWTLPRSPSVSEFYVRQPQHPLSATDRSWNPTHPTYYPQEISDARLTQPVYEATPEPHHLCDARFLQVPPRTAPINIHPGHLRTRMLPPSPRPVARRPAQPPYAGHQVYSKGGLV